MTWASALRDLLKPMDPTEPLYQVRYKKGCLVLTVICVVVAVFSRLCFSLNPLNPCEPSD